MKKLKELKEDYQLFIEQIPTLMDRLKTILDVDQLVYNIPEIDKVQLLYENNYERAQNIDFEDDELKSIFCAYFGTAWMWHFGGNWFLETDKKISQYGMACIEEHGAKDEYWVAICPEDWADSIETQQLDDPLSASFDYTINYYKNNPDLILEPVRDIQ